MSNTQADSSAQRKSRVKLIKRGIIILFFVIIILPILLCIYLLNRVQTLEEQVDELYQISREKAAIMAAAGPQETVGTKVETAEKDDTVNAETDQAVTHSREDFEQQLAKMTLIEEPKVSTISDNTVVNNWPKKVYLTFDDGPSFLTDDILDVLAQYNVKATFFVIGTDNPELIKMYKRIVEEGHTLGMHSYSHKYQDIYQSQEAFAQDLNKLENQLYEETGVIPKVYRFPGGSSNTVSPISMEFFIDYLNAKDITYFDWNISSGDASAHLLSKDEIVQNALYGIEENEETMILMHDIGDKTTTLEALPEIIEALQERGIPICAIDEDTMSIQHILE